MFNVGDVVFGKFATADGSVLRHHSVVLQASPEGVVLAYTTSMKESVHRANPAQRFTAEDMQQANWQKPCLWDASRISVVPASEVQKTGRITRATLQRIIAAYARARQTKTVSIAMLSMEGKVVTA